MNKSSSNWISYTLHVHVPNNRKGDNWLIYEKPFNIKKPIISKKNKYYNWKYVEDKINYRVRILP